MQQRSHAADEDVGFNGKLAAALTTRVGSMWAVYLTIVFVLSWIGLATWGFLRDLDPYPFPFLLFLGNVVQLLLVFIILVGQQILGRAADQRALQTYDDAEGIFREVSQLHDHLAEQDRILTRGSPGGGSASPVGYPAESDPAGDSQRAPHRFQWSNCRLDH